MLKTEQRAELDQLGPETVRFKLVHSGAGRGASVEGFRCGRLDRGDVEDWLADKAAEDGRQRAATLRWAVIAGIAGIVAAVLAAIQLFPMK
jgi:hypothetical protein